MKSEAWHVMHIHSYHDFPRVQEWVRANGGAMVYGQQDPGPVYGIINTPQGPCMVYIGDAIALTPSGGFAVVSCELIEHKRTFKESAIPPKESRP